MAKCQRFSKSVVQEALLYVVPLTILPFSFLPEIPVSELSSPRFTLFVQCFNQVPDPRSKHGTYHPFRTILALVFLGLLGNVTTLAEIERWTKLHFPQLKKFLTFRYKKKKGVREVGGTI